jgi:hypothetical protein
MIRMFYLILIAPIAACCSAPISGAQHDISLLTAEYLKDLSRETAYKKLPYCSVAANPCVDKLVKSKMITADYNAGAALLTAQSKQTFESIKYARERVGALTALVGTLPVKP